MKITMDLKKEEVIIIFDFIILCVFSPTLHQFWRDSELILNGGIVFLLWWSHFHNAWIRLNPTDIKEVLKFL